MQIILFLFTSKIIDFKENGLGFAVLLTNLRSVIYLNNMSYIRGDCGSNHFMNTLQSVFSHKSLQNHSTLVLVRLFFLFYNIITEYVILFAHGISHRCVFFLMQ